MGTEMSGSVPLRMKEWDADSIYADNWIAGDTWTVITPISFTHTGYSFVCPLQWIQHVPHRHWATADGFPSGWRLEDTVPLESPWFGVDYCDVLVRFYHGSIEWRVPVDGKRQDYWVEGVPLVQEGEAV